jgi:DNA-directed RNA polymerase specialized sigma24 family protein
VTAIDQAFESARQGDRQAFGDWMGRVERPIRASLARFARAVDVEAVVQETLLRMWTLACDPGRELTGENASLRFALGVARNLARAEARRFAREDRVDPHELPEVPVEPEPVPSPGLRAAIEDCWRRLAGRPGDALRLRVSLGAGMSDQELAPFLGMTLNTFLQNVVRARRRLADCLRGRGVDLREVLR